MIFHKINECTRLFSKKKNERIKKKNKNNGRKKKEKKFEYQISIGKSSYHLNQNIHFKGH